MIRQLEPDSAPGGLNPFGFSAVESVALLLLDAHRMLEDEAAELQKFKTYQKLSTRAASDIPGSY